MRAERVAFAEMVLAVKHDLATLGEDAEENVEDDDAAALVDGELIEDASSLALAERESHKGFWSNFVDLYFG